MRPCFTAHALGSDSRARVFVAGADSGSSGVAAHVLIFDGDGDALGRVPLDRTTAATGIAATRDGLLVVTGARGLLRFRGAEIVPGRSGARCAARSSRRCSSRPTAKMRAAGCASRRRPVCPKEHDRDRLSRRPTTRRCAIGSQRVRTILAHGEPARRRSCPRARAIWRAPTRLPRQRARGATAAAVRRAPLFDVRERYVWVCIALSASPGAPSAGAARELDVLYPGPDAHGEPAGDLSAREVAAGQLPARAGRRARSDDPGARRAHRRDGQPHPSVDGAGAVARFRRALARRAVGRRARRSSRRRRSSARGRSWRRPGTRAGLETLLESLIPERRGGSASPTPPRISALRPSAAAPVAAARSRRCSAAHAGAPSWIRARCSAHMRLPCAGQLDDGTWRLAGQIRVDVAASAEERRGWEPWLLTLINEMVPLTARVRAALGDRAAPAQRSGSTARHARGGARAASRHRRGHRPGAPARAAAARLSASGPDDRHTPALMTGEHPCKILHTSTTSIRRSAKRECCTDAPCDAGLRNNYSKASA